MALLVRWMKTFSMLPLDVSNSSEESLAYPSLKM